MDFIERLFGISPDGGNGVLEAVYFAVIGAVVFMILGRRNSAYDSLKAPRLLS